MTDPETMARLLTQQENADYEHDRRTENAVCAKCQDAPANPSSFYPELCPTCDDIAYGEDLDGADTPTED